MVHLVVMQKVKSGIPQKKRNSSINIFPVYFTFFNAKNKIIDLLKSYSKTKLFVKVHIVRLKSF